MAGEMNGSAAWSTARTLLTKRMSDEPDFVVAVVENIEQGVSMEIDAD